MIKFKQVRKSKLLLPVIIIITVCCLFIFMPGALVPKGERNYVGNQATRGIYKFGIASVKTDFMPFSRNSATIFVYKKGDENPVYGKRIFVGEEIKDSGYTLKFVGKDISGRQFAVIDK